MKSNLSKVFRTCYNTLLKNGSILKTILLKLILNNQEKRFYWLIAPEDITRTKATDGYLWKYGWWPIKKPEQFPFTNPKGEFIPWFTFPATAFLRLRLKKDLKVFEYGSGSSTFFFAHYVETVQSIEHNRDWFKKVSHAASGNIGIEYIPLNDSENYTAAVLNTDSYFDIIVVDGRKRIECCKAAIQALTERGIIILDDSQRDRYLPAVKQLEEAGFRRLDFYGLRVQGYTETCTSIFYKRSNCLAI